MGHLIKALIAALAHVWFFLVVTIVTIAISPLLIPTVIREQDYPKFFWLARNIWANAILYGSGMWQKIRYEQYFDKSQGYILVANHTSLLDVMLMYRASPNPFVFIGKKELSKIPIFGFFCKRVTILVDRSNLQSRRSVYADANRYIEKGYSICIFPEGGIPDVEVFLSDFKDGAFRLSIQNQIDILPMTFLDNKRRLPYNPFVGGFGLIRAVVHQPVSPKNLKEKDKETFKVQIRELILNTLIAHQSKDKIISEKETISS